MDHSFVQINSYFRERYVSFLRAILRISWLINISALLSVILSYLSKETLQNGKLAAMFLF